MADRSANRKALFESAKCYSETSSFQKNSGYNFIQQLSPRRGHRVLDLGCGTGYLAAALSECVGAKGKVIAVDPDGERLKLAEENYARDNIDYVNGDDETFPNGPYDLVFANQLVQWVKKKKALFGRVYESLKSGGRFAFKTANGVPGWPPVASACASELFGPDFLDHLYYDRMLFLTSDQYQELATSHGFHVTSMGDKDVPNINIGSVNGIIDFLFGLLHGELDQETVSEQVVKSCKDKYEDDLHSEANLYPTVKMLHVVLTKP